MPLNTQKQPPEMFCKKSVLKSQQNSQETPVLESLFNKVAGQKETPTQVFSYEYCKIFTNTYFEEHLLLNTEHLFWTV